MLYASDSQSELAHYLESDERLVWSGKPKSGIIFRPFDVFLIPFSLLWCGFAIFWFVTAAQASFFFALFGIPFVIIGLLMVFGRFIIDSRQRKNTIYGLTSKRLIIRTGVFSANVRSIDISSMSNLEMVEKQDGSGTISWGITQPFSSAYSGMNWWPGVKMPPSIEMIPDVRMVFNKLRNLQSSESSASI
jgi:hypothetical protein